MADLECGITGSTGAELVERVNQNTHTAPLPDFPADEGLALVARESGNDWEKIIDDTQESTNTTYSSEKIVSESVSTVADNIFTGINTFIQKIVSNLGIELKSTNGSINLTAEDGVGAINVELPRELNKMLPTAWVSFDGTDGSIIDSYGAIVSVDRNNTGQYIITTDLDKMAGSISHSAGALQAQAARVTALKYEASTFNTIQINVGTLASSTPVDADYVSVTVFGGKN